MNAKNQKVSRVFISPDGIDFALLSFVEKGTHNCTVTAYIRDTIPVMSYSGGLVGAREAWAKFQKEVEVFGLRTVETGYGDYADSMVRGYFIEG